MEGTLAIRESHPVSINSTAKSRRLTFEFLRLFLISATLVGVPIRAQTPAPTPADSFPARAEDVRSADAILKALFDVISGPAGQPRDGNRFRSLFAPSARIVGTVKRPDGTVTIQVRSPEDWVRDVAPRVQQTGFFVHEIFRKTEVFGNIVDAFSTNEKRHAADDPQPFGRGIDSFQLANDGKRWWIMSVLGDSERPGNPIPARYLPRENR